ncbi:hypothetical protein [Paraburkholderia caballeronis]|uniref:hypothetical protein n=1 Tax=Paraburkholderia caballeronis TaxID=416943 RepID=UPI0010669B5A|nr:hypothetical protein [Paraburkholderia caballeronis]
MSRRTYPRIGAEANLKNKLCSCCTNKAVKRIDIQTNWMRGDDDVMNVCGRHLEIARVGNWVQLYAAQKTTKEARRQPQRGNP